MRIRFRASDFGLAAQINVIRAKSKQASCAEYGARVNRFFARVIQQLGFWAQKIQAYVDYCYVRRRAECASLGPGLEHPSLRSLTLVWPRRDVPRRFTWCFLSTKHSSPSRELLLCVYSRMMRSHEKRALGVLLSSFSRSEPASTDS